ncbi:MAG: serine hydrolase [Ignavibacteriaceae bacterium]|nr:serine hydrolase [Ignavibacteriaceae bacterium]
MKIVLADIQSAIKFCLTPVSILGLVRFNRVIVLTSIKTNSQKLFLFTLLLFIPLVQNSYSQDLNNKLSNFLTEYKINKGVPSISGGVSLQDSIIWLDAIGFADVENSVPANTNTLYRIASISKFITSVAIMQLVESGRIKLDEDARTYLPYFPKKKWSFTVRQLLNHTSGIRSYRYGEFNSTESFHSIKDAIRTVINDTLEFQPGTKYNYSTLAYNLLAGIIEHVSELSYEEYLKKYIFQPSGMKSTFLEYQPKIIYNKARGYIKNNLRQFENAQLADLSIKFPGGGIISSSGDLLKFANSIINFKLINKSSLDKMLQPTVINRDTLNYGLGLSFGVDHKGRKYFGHSGGGTGFVSDLIIYPDLSLATVYLMNIRDRNLENPAKSFASIFLDNEQIKVKKSLADRLLEIYLQSNIDSVLNALLQITKDSSASYKTDKDELVLFGYDLIAAYNYTDAVTYFRYLISRDNNFAKYYVGLADAYYIDGNKGLAVKNFRHALSLDPKEKYAQDMIKRIENE